MLLRPPEDREVALDVRLSPSIILQLRRCVVAVRAIRRSAEDGIARGAHALSQREAFHHRHLKDRCKDDGSRMRRCGSRRRRGSWSGFDPSDFGLDLCGIIPALHVQPVWRRIDKAPLVLVVDVNRAQTSEVCRFDLQ